MKKFNLVLFIILSLILTSSISAENLELDKDYSKIENNLLVGLAAENQGLRISSAYFLGEIGSEKAVIPLLRMLKNSESEEERIIAALSLAKIESERGIFAIKQRMFFDESERVKNLCKIFYHNYRLENRKSDIIVEPFNLATLIISSKDSNLRKFKK